VLGEVVISSDRVAAQAAEYGHSVAEEMTRLLVHGLLHLLGDEHDTVAGKRRMRARETEWRARLDPWVVKLHTSYHRTS
jgi:probable rRNA maturation factor